MSIDHLLEDADPADAARAAHIAAEATKDDTGATDAERAAARELLALSVDDLARRFTGTRAAAASPSERAQVVTRNLGLGTSKSGVVRSGNGRSVVREVSATTGRVRSRSGSTARFVD